jgi:hypothetical protein
MRLINRKNGPQRLLKTVSESLDMSSGSRFGLPGGGGPGKTLKASLPNDTALKAGLIAGGLAGLTAGSAGISSLRRRMEGAVDDS